MDDLVQALCYRASSVGTVEEDPQKVHGVGCADHSRVFPRIPIGELASPRLFSLPTLRQRPGLRVDLKRQHSWGSVFASFDTWSSCALNALSESALNLPSSHTPSPSTPKPNQRTRSCRKTALQIEITFNKSDTSPAQSLAMQARNMPQAAPTGSDRKTPSQMRPSGSSKWDSSLAQLPGSPQGGQPPGVEATSERICSQVCPLQEKNFTDQTAT